MAGREDGVVRVPEGWIYCPAILAGEEAEAVAASWAAAMLDGKVPVLEGGMRFVPFSPEAAMRMKARRYLSRVGKLEHPDADVDPVGALGQVAVDFAQGLALVPPAAERERLALEERRRHFDAARAAVRSEFEAWSVGGADRDAMRAALVQALNDAEAAL